jgi:hypothetical protein
MKPSYHHTQVGWAIIIPLVFILIVTLGIAMFSTRTLGAWHLISGACAVVLSLFCTLTVTVADGWVSCSFGVGLIRRRIRGSDVQRAETVRNKWYYGWGIRLTPHGWLWNVAGLDAVELTFNSGKKFRVGADEPENLVEAISASVKQVNSLK